MRLDLKVGDEIQWIASREPDRWIVLLVEENRYFCECLEGLHKGFKTSWGCESKNWEIVNQKSREFKSLYEKLS